MRDLLERIIELEAQLQSLETRIVKPRDISVRAYRASAYSHSSSGSYVSIPFTDEDFDTDGMHDNATNNERLTAQRAGKFLIGANCQTAANSTGSRRVRIRLNGATVIALVMDNDPDGTLTCPLFASVLYDLSANDYVTCDVFQDSGGSLDISAVTDWSPQFWMVKMG